MFGSSQTPFGSSGGGFGASANTTPAFGAPAPGGFGAAPAAGGFGGSKFLLVYGFSRRMESVLCVLLTYFTNPIFFLLEIFSFYFRF